MNLSTSSPLTYGAVGMPSKASLPVAAFLDLKSDPPMPGLSNNPDACLVGGPLSPEDTCVAADVLVVMNVTAQWAASNEPLPPLLSPPEKGVRQVK